MAKVAPSPIWYVRLTSHSRYYGPKEQPWSETGSRSKCEAGLKKLISQLDADDERYLVEWTLINSGASDG